jgi:hypothetical protein
MKKLFLMLAVVVALAGCNSSTNVTSADYVYIPKAYTIYPKNYTIVVDTVYADSLVFICHFDVKATDADTITKYTIVTFYDGYSKAYRSANNAAVIKVYLGMGNLYTLLPATNSVRYYIWYQYDTHHSNFNQYANLDSVYQSVSIVTPKAE